MSLMEKIRGIKRKDGTSIWEPKENAWDTGNEEPDEIEYDKIEYNEKGQIKRDGFSMRSGTINYGDEFEKENFERVYKPLIIFLICFFFFSVIAIILIVKFLLLR